MFDFGDDDELFGGTPEKKYFDIIFNANRNLVENALSENLKRIVILERLLEERLKDGEDLDILVSSYAIDNMQEVETALQNSYIHGMGDILTQNE